MTSFITFISLLFGSPISSPTPPPVYSPAPVQKYFDGKVSRKRFDPAHVDLKTSRRSVETDEAISVVRQASVFPDRFFLEIRYFELDDAGVQWCKLIWVEVTEHEYLLYETNADIAIWIP